MVHNYRRGLLAALGLVLFYIFVVPQLYRFRFRLDLSLYDLGFYGLSPSRSYVSTSLTSPLLEFVRWDARCDPGFVFLTPRGFSVDKPSLNIFDAQGELAWKDESWGEAQDFKVQQYRGENYLTFWAGVELDIHGNGSWYMLNSFYQPSYNISPVGEGLVGDLHEFHITSNDTALVTIYDPIPSDLTSLGGSSSGWVYDALFQEIDIETGKLLFEWRASQHYPVESTFLALDGHGDKSKPFDAFHINSVDKDLWGNYLVSMRHTHTISSIKGETGEVLWTLGGRLNEFSDVSNSGSTDFSWQHDARWLGNDTISILNNAAHEFDSPAPYSNGMVIQLDIHAREATLLVSYCESQEVLATSQGNMRVLENGNVFIGWGHSAAFTEFTADGEILCDVHFGASAYFSLGRIVSYRAFKGYWVGTPLTEPSAVVTDDGIYVSWNGATEVSEWQLEAFEQPSDESLVLESVPKTGFETRIDVPENTKYPFFRIVALDSDGTALGQTPVMQTQAQGSDDSSSVKLWILITTALFGCVLYVIWLSRKL
ncbi:hypothetical protein NFIA_002430 [Paecilomyces variotii No. 5]|uniref:ASST-domain-containing protein n=1 Tax=Byssochlamys spectabilis (strain No. 5 / NBRC 109023) TaxID=1356009 RepID=V5FLV4_BYSSN|nr:hypothetical protein NFIA_002430 [Paecilomyces variotii No. 5]